MPWGFIPFIFVLSIVLFLPRQLTGAYFAWDLRMLLMPVSAWIGYRYGPAGVKTVIYACVLLFLSQIRFGDLRFGLGGGLVLACIALAWVVSSPDHFDRIRNYLQEKPYRLAWVLILPIAYLAPRTGIFQWSVNSVVSVYVAFFILGLTYGSDRSRRILWLIGCMFVVGATIYALTAIYGPLPRELRALRYTYSSPNSIVAIAIFLAAGRWCRIYAETGRPPQRISPFGTPITLVLILLFGLILFLIRPDAAPAMRITGSYVSILLGCFLAGLFYGTRGFFLVMLAVGIAAPLTSIFFGFSGRTSILDIDLRITITDRLRLYLVFETLIWFLWTCVGVQVRSLLAEKTPHENASRISRGAK